MLLSSITTLQVTDDTTGTENKVKAKDFKFIQNELEKAGIKSSNICEKLLEKYLTVKAGDRLMPNDEAISAAIELAKYIEEHGDSKLSAEDVIIRVLYDIMRIHCCVLTPVDTLKNPSTAKFSKLKIAANRLNRRLGYKDQRIVWTFKFHVFK